VSYNNNLPPLPPAAGRGEERTPAAPLPLTESDNPTENPQQEAPGQEIPEDMQRALQALVEAYELECDSVRRHYVRRFREAEEFWRGNQNLYWSEADYQWHTPFDRALESGSLADLPRYDYVNNIYQAFGLSVIAAISQRLPRVRFQPVSALREEDVATARAASIIADLIERNNRLDLLAIREAYLLWTQGIFGAYVRYVVDDEFGSHAEPIVEMATVQVRQAGLTCPRCGEEIPFARSAALTADQDSAALGTMPRAEEDEHGSAGQIAARTHITAAPGGAAVASSDLDSPFDDALRGLLPPSSCPRCGADLAEASSYPAEYMQVPVISRIENVPNGQEVISIYGGLNLKLMPYANTLRESGYLILAEEQHVAALRAAYPAKADEIEGDAGAFDTYERLSRMALVDAPGSTSRLSYQALATYKRCWLRPWAFWAHEDPDMRARLLETFPNGCMVAFAGDTFLEARDEAIDDHWRVCRAMPGVGMYHEPIGASLVSIQKRINDLANIQAEHVEYGAAPPILYDARYINGQALAHKRMEPASYTPVAIESAPSVKSLAEMIYQPTIGLDPNVYSQGHDLMELSQFLTGALPAVFGGNMPDVSTASGYGMARDQALGRLGLFWRQMKEFHADLMMAAVDVFRENRTQDVEQVIVQRSGDYASRFVRLTDLKGNVTAHPEADDAFPATWAEIRQNVLRLLDSKDPYILKVLSHPMNADLMKNYAGTPDLVLPDADNRTKQFREIAELLQGEPVHDPAAGWLPTVLPEPAVDDSEVHADTIREWAVSDNGIAMKRNNPGGYANVIAHLLAHQRILAQAAGVPQPTPVAPATGEPKSH
jgi:hypothetical protein